MTKPKFADERADVHNMLNQLEVHAPTWIRAIRRYVEKLERNQK